MKNKKNVASSIGAVIVAGVFGNLMMSSTVATVEQGKAIYHYNTDTVMVKKHCWSKPVKCYAKNLKPVASVVVKTKKTK